MGTECLLRSSSACPRVCKRGHTRVFRTIKDFSRCAWRSQSSVAPKAGGDSSSSSNQERSKDGEAEASWEPKFVMGDDEHDSPLEHLPAIAENGGKLFTAKSREKFWGRLAVLSLGAVLLSERLSGKGIVTALNMATGVPIWEIEPFLGLLVGAILAVGLYPLIRRLGEDPAESLQKKLELTVSDSFQVVTGRLACVALAGTILAEATTGKGILALLHIDTGVEISEIEGGLTFLLLLLFTNEAPARKQ